jgi:hypothetical protein
MSTTCGSTIPVSRAVFIAVISAVSATVRWASKISINVRVPAASPRARRAASLNFDRSRQSRDIVRIAVG